MIVAGFEYKGARPFSNVYLTGLVRDKQRRKMSKSLGNSPDALKLIADYGADGVRVGLLLSSAAGNDLLFDEALCQQGKGFGNKLWNAFQLVKGWQVDTVDQPAASKLALQWFDAKFNAVLTEVEDHFEKYRISDALMAIYKLAWDDFCAWLLEMVKPEYGKPMDKATYEGVVAAFENLLKLLHPFMPFLTEEIWQSLAPRTPEQALIVATYPTVQPYDEKLLAEFDFAAEVIAGIRTVRKEKNIPFKTPLSLSVLNKEQVSNRFDAVITKMGGLEAIAEVSAAIEGAMSFRVKANEYFIPIGGAVNVEEELKTYEKLKDEGMIEMISKGKSNYGYPIYSIQLTDKGKQYLLRVENNGGYKQHIMKTYSATLDKVDELHIIPEQNSARALVFFKIEKTPFFVLENSETQGRIKENVVKRALDFRKLEEKGWKVEDISDYDIEKW